MWKELGLTTLEPIQHIRSEIGTVGGFRYLKSDGTIGHLKDGETMEMPT